MISHTSSAISHDIAVVNNFVGKLYKLEAADKSRSDYGSRAQVQALDLKIRVPGRQWHTVPQVSGAAGSDLESELETTSLAGQGPSVRTMASLTRDCYGMGSLGCQIFTHTI